MMRQRECEREALHAEKAIVYVADNGFFSLRSHFALLRVIRIADDDVLPRPHSLRG